MDNHPPRFRIGFIWGFLAGFLILGIVSHGHDHFGTIAFLASFIPSLGVAMFVYYLDRNANRIARQRELEHVYVVKFFGTKAA